MRVLGNGAIQAAGVACERSDEIKDRIKILIHPDRRGTQAVSVARVRSVGARLRGAAVQSAGASPQGSSSRREAAATRDYGGWRLIQGLDGGAPQ